MNECECLNQFSGETGRFDAAVLMPPIWFGAADLIGAEYLGRLDNLMP